MNNAIIRTTGRSYNVCIDMTEQEFLQELKMTFLKLVVYRRSFFTRRITRRSILIRSDTVCSVEVDDGIK